jgi:hypothetical protein
MWLFVLQQETKSPELRAFEKGCARIAARVFAKAALKSGDAMASAHDTKLETQYKLARERCDALSGVAKEACVRDAKARYGQ